MKIIIKAYIICTVALLSLNNSIAQAPKPDEPLFPSEYKEQLKYFADKYGSNYNVMSRVINCESGWRPDVYGDSGKAFSLAQFHKPTFEAFSKEMGLVLDYYIPTDQLQVMSWAFANGKESHWTCFSKI